LWVFVDTKDSNTKKYFYYSQPKISCTTKTHENGLKRQFPSVISVMMIFYRKMFFDDFCLECEFNDKQKIT